ncbi:MFS transporter [Amycolatopsis suaedae]|uniref:MFS transporter n=1 Tax=Amycolatopsis suaedae TaxID=2510978 RepID=A0A4Q7J165_9PSEU|nr:MFS transporter [Amycolatopsis suaedae]RZQ60166.1 MFS transporter [Amycolatopsis suaedae]
MRTALGNVEFRALWAAETQSLVGDQLTTVALTLTVYARTGSPLWSALTFALTFLPALAGGLGLSQLADRFPRRTVLATSLGIQAVLVGLMAIPGTPLVVLCTLLALARLAGSPTNAAQNALTRDIFDDDELYLRSQDLRGVTMNVAMLAGLAGGGVLVTQLGASLALALDAVTFLISTLVILRWVRHRPAVGKPGEPWFGATRWVFSQPRLRVLLAMSWLVGLAVVPEGLVAPLAMEIGAPQEAVGWLLAADPLGFVIGVFLLSRWVSAESRRRVMGWLAVVPAALLIAFLAQPSLPLSLLLLGFAGMAGAYIVTVGATFITWTPNEFRGGGGGLYRTGLRVAQGIGVAAGGVVAELVGSATNAIAIAGIAGVLLGAPVALRWARELRTA